MGKRSSAVERKQAEQHGGWQPAAGPQRGLLTRSSYAHISQFRMDRTVLISTERLKELEPKEYPWDRLVRMHIIPSIDDAGLSYRRHEIVEVPSEGDTKQYRLAFVFKRPRHAMLFKLMWG